MNNLFLKNVSNLDLVGRNVNEGEEFAYTTSDLNSAADFLAQEAKENGLVYPKNHTVTYDELYELVARLFTMFVIMVQRETGAAPTFIFEQERDDKNHATGMFTSSFSFHGPKFIGYGRTKKGAKFICSYRIMMHLRHTGYEPPKNVPVLEDKTEEVTKWIATVRSFYGKFGFDNPTDPMYCAFIAPQVLTSKPYVVALESKAIKPFSYESLETYGDSILGFWALELVFSINKTPKTLTDEKKALVNNHRLSVLAKQWSFDTTLLSVSPVTEDMRADVVEATIGAVYNSYGIVRTTHYIRAIFAEISLKTK